MSRGPWKKKPIVIPQLKVASLDSTVIDLRGVQGVPQPLNPYKLIIGVRTVKDGAFKGLWETFELNPDLTVKKQLAAPTSKGYAINQANKAMLRLAQ